ncbi:FAD-dependent oxidoreductase [Paraphotobacterium marinum]|uniref:FAD-dependent oxidoreductase n=1 Tax=Paraphotobacterium marinum TaxID=1755811 RepID=A0A220VGW9_9GAMM|nr:NAD(P)/FAD-dependent oxidoreductase [Paraphotobacterium marinum]ASK79658.1 FAD-dependent oxidoreductase [Paraphotobacterium marinum]
MSSKFPIVIIGAGPAGLIAASILLRNNIDVLVIEKSQFPRFSIGESLLPAAMDIINNAGLMGVFDNNEFQMKKGALFHANGKNALFDFSDQFTIGYKHTYQIPRDQFDNKLAQNLMDRGLKILFQHEVKSVELKDNYSVLTIQDSLGTVTKTNCSFIIDASGFGRLLPNLLNLKTQTFQENRQAIFKQIQLPCESQLKFPHEITIVEHTKFENLWIWLIPFKNNICSVGIVGNINEIQTKFNLSDTEIYDYILNQEDFVKEQIKNYHSVNQVRSLSDFSASSVELANQHYAIVGNSGEFLDPIFSSGMTLAMKSAELVAHCLIKKHQDNFICWQNDYEQPFRSYVNVFKVFVNGWYDGSLKNILFYNYPNHTIKRMVCSILAGYVWDNSNPFVKEPKRMYDIVHEYCK